MEEQLSLLNERLERATDFMEIMELEGEIHDLEVRLGRRLPPKPIESEFNCIGCSA